MTPVGRSYAKRIRSDGGTLWKSSRPRLTWLDVELTERCNHDCVHCNISRPADDADARRREMTTEEIRGILEQTAALGCLTVRLTGGEPLVREDFEEIYLAARRLGMRVMVFTNAALLTPRLASLFADVPPLEKIGVSVYGMTASTYEAVTRTPGSFQAFRRGLGLLAGRGVPFVVKGAILPGNRYEQAAFEAWAAALPGSAGQPSSVVVLDLHGRRDEGKNGVIRRLRMSPGETAAILNGATPADIREFVFRFAGPPGDSLFTCLAAQGKGTIDAYGKFQYCLLLRHPETVFDLRAGTLRQALEEFLPALRSRKAANPEYLRRCARCFLKALCLQCPAKSWAEHGTLDAPVDYLCEITHAQAEALGILARGEKSWAVSGWEARLGRTPGVSARKEAPACREA